MFRLVKYRTKFAAEWWENGERFRRSLGTSDHLIAQVAFERFKALMAEERRQPVTLKTCWDGYRATLGARPASVTMGYEWKSIGPAFGDRLATAISESEVRAYIQRRRDQGRSDGTIWTELGRVRMALAWAVRKDLIAKAPEIVRPAPPPPRDKHMTVAQVERFIEACELPHIRLWALLAIGTAARASALLELKWDRVDFERGLIVLHNPERSKTRKGRATVPMTDTLRAALSIAHSEALGPHVIDWGGHPVKSVKKAVSAAGKRAGLPWVTPHVFRHSAARIMAEGGVPMSEIAQYLGHTDSRVTERVYGRYSPDYLRRASAPLEIGGSIKKIRAAR